MNGNIGPGEKYGFSGWQAPFTNSVTKSGGFTIPGPTMSWVFLDEHPDWIDDAQLYIYPGDTNGTGQFTEVPGSYHNKACGISFADGHAEIHKWVTPQIVLPVTLLFQQGLGNNGLQVTANQDLIWMAQRTPFD